MEPKKLLHNVLILKMDVNFGQATALAWEGDKILAIGSSEELVQRYPDAEKIDGNGLTVLPGFIDPHIHFMEGILFQGALDCSSSNVLNIEDLKQALKKAALHHEKDQWVFGHGYDPWTYPGKNTPTRYDLDEACPDNPVVIVHYSFHECVANSRALALANITKNSVQPIAGIIKKDKNGNPTGHLIETAMGKVLHLSKTNFIEQKKKEMMHRITSFQETLWGFGITRIGDPAVQNVYRALYQEAYETGILKTPVFMYPCNDKNMLELPIDKLNQPFQIEDNEMLKTGPLKIFLDGGDRAAMIFGMKQLLQSTFITIIDSIRTLSLTPIKTSLRSPVRLGKDLMFHLGLLMTDTIECQHLVSKAIKKDFSIAFHAIGNEAIQQAIQIIRQAALQVKHSFPVQIVHCLFMNNEMVKQIKATGATVVTQPYFLTHMSRENIPYLPGLKQLPLRSLIDAGIHVAGSSDWPVVSCDPLSGIERAVTRVTRGKEILQEQEAITIDEAFAMYTREAARALGCLDETGTLEPGKRADFILLTKDPTNKEKSQWRHVKVEKTFIGGKMMFP